MKAANIGGPLVNWRLRGNHLLCYPAPAAGHTIAFEYASNFGVCAADGTTYKMYVTADDDQLLLPARLLQMWLRWRWKKEKGFPYDEDFRLYETFVNAAASQDNEGRILDMSPDDAPGPGIFIPAGTWVIR
jgi:hypothetical protein